MPNNIIDSIRLSGTTYQIQGSGGGGTQAIELTQAQYDALVDKDPNVFYIITDAEAGDLTNYYTKTETNTLLGGKADTATTYTKTEVDTALNGKQDQLVSGTNIKTINNESILGSGNIDIQGGGKAVSGGTNISITTGETADTINCTLPISADTGGIYTTSSYPFTSNAPRGYNAVFGNSNVIDVFGSRRSSYYNALFGNDNGVMADGGSSSSHFIAGSYNKVRGTNNFQNALFGYNNNSQNNSEFGCGRYNNSVAASSTFGDSGNTLFSVGNGTSASARHNAFEIRQNGDIYIADTNDTSTTNWYEKPMIKLQDQLGGGGSSYTAGDGIDITNDVISVTGKVDTSTYNTYTAATDTALANKADTATTYTKTEVDTALASKQTTLTAGTGISIVDNVISATGGGGGGLTEDDELLLSTALTDLNDRKIDASEVKSNYQKKGDYATKDYVVTALEPYETKANVEQVEEVTSYALNDLNQRFGGLKIVKITETEYAALATKDENTLYIVVSDPS